MNALHYVRSRHQCTSSKTMNESKSPLKTIRLSATIRARCSRTSSINSTWEIKMDRLKGTLAAIVVALAPAVAASAAEDTGFYLGVGLGQSTLKNDDDGVDVDEDDTGFKIFGGYQLNNYLAAELSYIDLGKAERSFSNSAAPRTPGNAGQLEVETYLVNLSAVGTYAFNDYFGAMG